MGLSLLSKPAWGLFAMTSIAIGSANAQALSGTYTVGTGGNYPDLTGAGGLFHAINNNGMSGNVTATIISDITEPATDSLKDFTAGGTINYRLVIRPDAATQRNLTSTSAGAMMTFFGARNLTVDGSFAGGGTYLRISNDNSGNNAGAMMFLNGCRYDTVKNVILESSSAYTSPTVNIQKAATVLLDASITGMTGNSDLVFSGNIFQNVPSAANLPGSHLRAINISAAAGDNNAIVVTNNHFLNARMESIRTGSNATVNGNPGWTITGNALYADTQIPGASNKTGIFVYRGDGHIISNNYIGGSTATAGGGPYTYTGGQFTGIATASGSTNSIISTNTIANITVSFATPSATGAVLSGISISGGGTVSGNIVRDLTSNACAVVGYALSGTNDTAVGNTVKNLKSTFHNKTSGTAKNVNGFLLSSSSHYIAGNVIDSLTGSSGFYQYAAAPAGIYLNTVSSPNTVIENNTITHIANLSDSSLTSYGATVAGIMTGGLLQPITVNGNYIADIYGTNTSATGNNIAGILDNSGSSSASLTQSYFNNVIVLGSSNLIPPTAWVSGIQLASAFNGVQYTLLNNSVSIPASVNLNSVMDAARRGGASCVTRINGTSGVSMENNILSNLGTNSNTGKMVAVNFLKDSVVASFYADYNVYNTSSVSSLIGYQDNAYSLSGWRSFKANDTNSTFASVPFMSGTDLHINTGMPGAWNVFGRGIAVATVANDKDGNARSTTIGIPVTAGAYEIATPSSVPADMLMVPAIPVIGTPTQFWSNGRKIAEINWAAGATLPVSLNAKFYPGVAAPFLDYAPKTNAYFEINETGFAGSYTIKQYVNTAEGAGQAFSSLRAAKRHGTEPYTFIANAGSNAIDANGNYLQSVPQTTFSTFGMTTGTVPLAIELKDINASNTGADNKISWTTVSEAEGNVFELQSAADGRLFNTIASINATGIPHRYSYTDRNAAEGITYYRLKWRRTSGEVTFSNIVNAFVSTNRNTYITVSPNPTSDMITIRQNSGQRGYLFVELRDMSGRLIRSVNTQEAEITVDLRALANGVYMVRTYDGQHTTMFKVVRN